MLQNILVPIDFSPPSLQTLRYAVAFAERFGARLHLIHVVDLPQYGILPPDFPNEVAKSANKRLTALAAQFSVSDRANPTTVVVGKVADEINNVARETRADLIIIATRGYSGLKYAFFGSTAEGVIRQAACPVLILRAERSAAKRSAVHVRKLLVPVDFSESSRVGMNYALEFAQEFGADVTLFHAVSLRTHFLGDQYTTRAAGPLIPQHNEYATSEMAKLRAAAESEGHSVRTHLAFGSAVERVSQYAERENVDLIIMSTHGRSGLRRLFIGSTAEQIQRYASGSVLVVPNRSVDACDVQLLASRRRATVRRHRARSANPVSRSSSRSTARARRRASVREARRERLNAGQFTADDS